MISLVHSASIDCLLALRMLRWMSGGHVRQDRIRNMIIREKVGVALLVEKMVEARLRLFEHVWKRSIE